MPASSPISGSSPENACFAPIEEGRGPVGQAFCALLAEVGRIVSKEVRPQLEGEAAGAGGPVEVEVELLVGCGRR